MARKVLHRRARLVTLALAAACQHGQAREEAPLWEVGAGVAALSFPAYRGSDQTSSFLMPIPFFTYHGDFFKADRHGLRGSLFDSDRLELTISLALSPPASSDKIKARSGMPDLEATFEIGPQMDVSLWRSADRARFVKLLLPLRAGFTLEGSPKDVGWVFHPKLNLDVTDLPGLSGWKLGLLAGPVFGDQRQHAYYYGVAPAHATPTRPAYRSSSGYAGMQYLVAFSRRYPRFWVGAFLRYDHLKGAVFDDSPLFRQRNYVAGGVAINWILGQSATRVVVDD